MIVGTARQAADLFAPLLAGTHGEKLVVAHLGPDRRLLAVIESAAAPEDHVEVPVRRILEDALRLGGCGLVLGHNHPSGEPEPSRQDLDATRELAETAARLGIRVHDHLILAGGDFRSFRALGLI